MVLLLRHGQMAATPPKIHVPDLPLVDNTGSQHIALLNIEQTLCYLSCPAIVQTSS